MNNKNTDNARCAIPSHHRLIHALDLPTVSQAKDRVAQLGEAVSVYKVGLQLFMDKECLSMVEWLRKQDKQVFVDLKMNDIPNTIYNAISGLENYGIQFATVQGSDSTIKAAINAKKNIKVLAVAELSSETPKKNWFGLSRSRANAKRAEQLGCDGVICSGVDVAGSRKDLNINTLLVVPGIRYAQNAKSSKDDQRKTLTPSEALRAGADYIVVGRPISESSNPLHSAQAIQKEISEFYRR